MNFKNAEFVASYGLGTQLPNDGALEIVFCGRSNVGKSTLINSLCERKNLARVSATPGKTATVNRYRIGNELYLMDLPGYGYAKRPQAELKRWGELLEYYFSSDRNIALCILALDCRREPSDDDVTMLECFKQAGLPFAVVITKSDKLSKTALAERVNAITQVVASYHPVSIVPFEEYGVSQVSSLRKVIEEAVEGKSSNGGGRW